MTTIRTSKPVCLLDIDGVLNSMLREPPTHVWPKQAWRKADYADGNFNFPLLWCNTVMDYLTCLHDEGRVEFRWHTSWHEKAPHFGEIVGLPKFEVAYAPEAKANQGLLGKELFLRGAPMWWKYPAAERVLVDEKRPLIWIDDHLNHRMPKVYRDGMASLHKTLLICPDGQTGLINRHMRMIEEFLIDLEEVRGAVSGS